MNTSQTTAFPPEKGTFSSKILLLILLVIGFPTISCKKNQDFTVKDKAELLEVLQDEMDKQKMTSLSFAVVKNGNLVVSDGLGYANESSKIQATAETRYLIASISKTITAVALMQLYEQQLFDLDDDINAFLPYSVRNPDFPNTPITFRMLLSHHSSISDNHQNTVDLYCYGSDCSMTLETYFEEIFTPSGQYYSDDNFGTREPGTREDYSNVGLALVGYLVERIANQPFDEYCKANIFQPLGMNKTEWRLANTPLSELAIPYSQDLTGGKTHYTFPDYPNGGLRTTVTDLSKFLRAIIQGGTFQGTQILTSSTINLMETEQFGSQEQCLTFYYTTLNGTDYLGHSGGEMGVTTEMLWDMETGIGAIAFNNDDDTNLENVMLYLLEYGKR